MTFRAMSEKFVDVLEHELAEEKAVAIARVGARRPARLTR